MSDKVKVKSEGVMSTFVKDIATGNPVEIIFDPNTYIAEVTKEQAKDLVNRPGGTYRLASALKAGMATPKEMQMPSMDRLEYEYRLLIKENSYLVQLREWFRQRGPDVEMRTHDYQRESGGQPVEAPEVQVPSAEYRGGYPSPVEAGEESQPVGLDEAGLDGSGIDGIEKKEAPISRAEKYLDSKKKRRTVV